MAKRTAVKRDRRLMVGFGLLGAASLLVAGWQATALGSPPPAAYNEITVTPGHRGEVSVAIAGDTMFGDKATPLIQSQGLFALLAGVSQVFRGPDVGVVNMEAPITNSTDVYDLSSQFSYGSPPESALALASIGVDVLQVGNNHILDRGPIGLDDTITHANRVGLATVGAGDNLTEAMRPLLIRTPDLTVALVSLGENFGSSKRATDTTAGMVPFSADVVLQEERVARAAGADRVIALAHWGGNYADIDESQRYWAGELVAAGYDLIIGTGPHVLQPIEVIDGVPVVYSLGNFVFGSNGRYAIFGQPGVGAVATVTFDATGATLELRCLNTDNTAVNFVTRECDATESAVAAARAGGGLTWQGAIGTLRF